MSWLLIIIVLGLLFLPQEILVIPVTTIAGVVGFGLVFVGLRQVYASKGIVEVFRNWNIGLMDYYKFQNIHADKRLRDSISDLNQHRKGQTGKQGE